MRVGESLWRDEGMDEGRNEERREELLSGVSEVWNGGIED